MDVSEWSDERRWGVVMGVSLALALFGSFLLIRWLEPDCAEGGCPSVDRMAEYRLEEPPQIFDAEGELAGTLSGAKRIVVKLDSIPEIVREGYVVVEDQRFRDHGGVDVTGGFRALLKNVRSASVEEGASTITMQLARNLFGPEVLTWNKWHRKLAEIRLAREIESQMSKDRILELYLNQIYLGGGVYGVQTAARHYFGKHVAEVTPREAAFLVGLAKNPEGYNPRDHPEEADRRIETVLDIMEEHGVIDAETAAAAREAELEVSDNRVVQDWGANAYYLNATRRELRRIVPGPAQRAGLRVFTGLDQGAQEAAVEALVRQIRAVETGRWGAFRGEPAPDSLPPSDSTSPYLQGMVVAMTPETGLVTTLVGGRDYGHSEFDRAFQAHRQAGSAFKPIVYAAALGQGLRLNQTIATDPVRFARQGGPDWQPSDHVRGEQLTVRDALVFSSNTAAVRIGQRIGTGRVAAQARAMGITSEIPSYPSIYLGAADVVPAELVAAYATFTNGGHSVEPHLITRIEDTDGRIVYRKEPAAGQRAVDSRIGFLVLDMMRDVVTRGTGWRVADSGFSFPAAGKTGTTNDSRDVWFIGMTPKLVAGVWLGFDKPRTIVDGVGGGQIAAPVWARFMQKANQGLGPMKDWAPPPGVTRARIDTETGYAVPEDCAFTRGEVRTEYFVMGSEPREYCPYERLTESGWWRSDTVRWSGSRHPDSVGDSAYYGRGVRYRPILDEDSAETLRRERRRRLDSLDAANRPSRPRDTLRIGRDTTRPDATPPDTTRPDTVRPDTTRPDTIRPDTIRPDTTRPDTTRPDTTRPDTTRSDTTGAPERSPDGPDQSAEAAVSRVRGGVSGSSSACASASMPPWASHRSASRAAMHPVPAAVTA